MKKFIVSKDDPVLQPIKELVTKQKRKTLIMWGLECAESILPIFEKFYREDNRPRYAIEAAKLWAQGKIKMPIAKEAALASHNAATKVEQENPAACAAARAMGQLVGIVHVGSHAIGFILYILSAFVYSNPKENIGELISNRLNWFYERMLYWEINIEKIDSSWASFLQKDDEKFAQTIFDS